MRRALHAAIVVAVVALTVLAGCVSGPLSGPSATPTAEEQAYPPGVTGDGLDDPRALVDAHVESVREDGAVANSNVTVPVPVGNGTRKVELTGEARVAGGGGPLYRSAERVRVAGDDAVTRERVETYANDTTVVRRVVTDGNASVVSEDRDRLAALRDRHAARDRLLLQTLTAGNFSVAGVEQRDDGRTVTTLVANEQSLGEEDGDSPSLFSARLTVTETGRVLSLSLTRDLDTDDPRTGRDVAVTWANGTTVDPPTWATTADGQNSTYSMR
ncbi:DUF7537 family lipoprotein [Halobacterium rubrum]|uniref:DUF7537 family lipoprotein n=1 Tax=Halobacterium TaxID=2239 RepID=UPI001F17751D|nr:MULTISPECIES: hypothetical protein [Halobacterium]MDH5019782.1 hypothetical protein [Halobacterium rubrum]